MKLSEYMSSGTRISRKGKLLRDFKLDNGENRKKGDIVSILIDFRNGDFHAEDNGWACNITSDEFKFIEQENNIKKQIMKDFKKIKFAKGSEHLHIARDFYPGHQSTEQITYFNHSEMIVAVHIKIGDKHGKYWNDTKEVLLNTTYKGYSYTLGLDEYKSERSLVLRINNFVKRVIKDKQIK